MSRDMPCGPCGVCGETVDHTELGICKECGNGFHWGECGGWVGNQRVCNNCQEADEEDDDHE